MAVYAQLAAPTNSTTTLNQATNSMSVGDYIQAKNLLISIPPDDSVYGSAQCYYALCCYKQNDMLGFIKAMKSPAAQAAVLPDGVKEELIFDQINVCYKYRRFDVLLPLGRSFRNEYPQSTNLNAVNEYLMAALYERGMKKATEGSILTETNESIYHWSDGEDNLKAFLLLASKYSGSNYQYVQGALLKEQVWNARIVLGDETNVLADLPLKAVSDRQRVKLLIIQQHLKLDPHDIDGNLQRMNKFIADYPLSKARKRLEFDMASISFQRGEELCKEADTLDRAGDLKGAAAKRSSASDYFNYTRSLQSNVTTNAMTGVEASDVEDLLEDYLYSYYLEKNYSQLATLAEAGVTNSTAGSQNWILGKVYRGIASQASTPPDLEKAAKDFDDVLLLDFNKRPDHNRLLLVAAKWRIHIAVRSADTATAFKIVSWVKDSNCTKNQRAEFLKKYASLLDSTNK